jgi:outer membrane protein assembly factor BamB
MLSTYGGRTNTPIVFDDLVIISGVTTGWDDTARPAHRFLAFDKSSGELVWQTSTRPLPEDTTYSTPVIRVIDGQAVMVAGAGDGEVYGIQPRTGKILWKEQLSRRGINTSVAIDDSGNVYATHGEENPQGTMMGAVVRIDAAVAALDSASSERWRTEELTVGKSSPLLVGDRLYVVEDSSRLHALNTETGAEIGKPIKLGTAMRGSLLYADGMIYAATSSGIFHVLQPTSDGIESIFKVRLPRGEEVGGSPIVSHRRLYLPTTRGLYCLGDGGVPAVNPSLTTAIRAAETERSGDDTVAQLQLVPAEAFVSPGQELRPRVVAFNARGQRLDRLPEDLKWELLGSGSIDSDGVFHADSSDEHHAAIVTAASGSIKATSRLRIVPPLPWKFDFSDGEVPITWIGARYRHEARQIDGDPAIVKISTIPKGTRSQTWFGPTDLHDYTITADVKAAGGTAKMPDIGVIAQRYTLDLMGESQQLQIRTWAAQLRMARSAPYAWQADQWYTLKLQASMDNGVALLRGKVWRRGQPEPETWTITATDETPNQQGSPGLFGNATNAEVFIDNVSITSNQ